MNRIKELRVENGWRQTDLAQKLHTRQQTIGNYETGERSPDVETILKLCEIFGCTADYLLGRSDLPSLELSDEEWELVAAFRQADADAKDMVRLALKRWTAAKPTESKDAAS